MKPLQMDVWHRLPPRGRVFGLNGAGTLDPLVLIPTSTTLNSIPSSVRLPVLVDGLEKAISGEDIRSLVEGSRWQSEPSARPVNWIEGETPSIALRKNTSSPLN